MPKKYRERTMLGAAATSNDTMLGKSAKFNPSSKSGKSVAKKGLDLSNVKGPVFNPKAFRRLQKLVDGVNEKNRQRSWKNRQSMFLEKDEPISKKGIDLSDVKPLVMDYEPIKKIQKLIDRTMKGKRFMAGDKKKKKGQKKQLLLKAHY